MLTFMMNESLRSITKKMIENEYDVRRSTEEDEINTHWCYHQYQFSYFHALSQTINQLWPA